MSFEIEEIGDWLNFWFVVSGGRKVNPKLSYSHLLWKLRYLDKILELIYLDSYWPETKKCKNKKCRARNFQLVLSQTELSAVRSQKDRGRRSYQKLVFPHFDFQKVILVKNIKCKSCRFLKNLGKSQK